MTPAPSPDTIFALATPPGRGALAIVRLSGPGVTNALTALSGKTFQPRHATLTKLYDPQTRDLIDHALVTYFKAPASFTGEDVCELSLHGGRAVVGAMLGALARVPGLRPAEPGEFTKRAFIHHKLDLTAAEAVADLIDAETALQHRQALSQLGGALGALYDRWRDDLIKACAYLEAHLDFPDEDLPDHILDHVRPAVEKLISELSAHLSDNHRGERLRDGLRVVILGAPNAGKSSLLNALSKRDAAIVSETAGTTRDVIDVHLDLAGYPVLLSDTAGLRAEELATHGQDAIEAEGIRRGMARARDADIKIVMFDAGLPSDPQSIALIDDQTLVVANKCDLPNTFEKTLQGRDVIHLSAATNTGIDELIKQITRRLDQLIGGHEGVSLTRTRHRAALEHCVFALREALNPKDTELAAEDLRAAISALGRITGRVDVDDLLDVIFRDFCIGK
jgi:tRNA modification GTPase